MPERRWRSSVFWVMRNCSLPSRAALLLGHGACRKLTGSSEDGVPGHLCSAREALCKIRGRTAGRTHYYPTNTNGRQRLALPAGSHRAG